MTSALGVNVWLKERQFAYAADWTRYEYASGSLIAFGMLSSYSVSFCLSVASSGFVIATQRFAALDGVKLTPAAAALAIGYSFLLPYYLCNMASIAMRLKMFMTSLERLLTIQELPQEASAVVAGGVGAGGGGERGEGAWPSGGAIVFDNVSLKYGPGLPTTLVNVSFRIAAGEKIGICGRTGAGKSSLLAALFRLVDAECIEGAVHIDGVDTHSVGLKTLRERIAIIPQEPLINEGTVRSNLDPFGKASAAVVGDALEGVGLERGFGETAVDNGGTNLSAGERQLICLARTLVMKALDEERFRIVCMDESTANLDFASDESTRRLIYDTLKGSTTLIIAHRLNTIIECDRIFVMDGGKIAEMGTPVSLLSNASSRFYEMADCLGDGAAEQMLAKARSVAGRGGGEPPIATL